MVDYKPLSVLIFVGTNISIEKFHTTPTYMEDMSYVPYVIVVGSLMYVMVCTRPNIAQAVGVLSLFMVDPSHEHWATMKRVFRYF
jgi:hypothetical protein